MELHYSHRLGSGRIARIVGTFVVIPILGMIILAVFMAKAEGLFKPHYRLYTNLSESFGLEPGASVVMSGIPIGRVETVTLTEKGDIDVALDLVRDYQTRIREDSVAVVGKSSPLVGATQVRIKIGDPAKTVIPDEGRIRAEEPKDVGELLKDVPALLAIVKRSLADVEGITKDARVAVQTGSRALLNVEEASKSLPQAVESVQRSLASVETTTAELPELTGSVRKSLATVEQAVQDVQTSTKRLPGIVDTAQESLNNVKEATESVKVTAKQLRPVIRSTQVALDETNTILRGAKNTWPVSALVKNAGAEPTPGPGASASLRGDQLAR